MIPDSLAVKACFMVFQSLSSEFRGPQKVLMKGTQWEQGKLWDCLPPEEPLLLVRILLIASTDI